MFIYFYYPVLDRASGPLVLDSKNNLFKLHQGDAITPQKEARNKKEKVKKIRTFPEVEQGTDKDSEYQKDTHCDDDDNSWLQRPTLIICINGQKIFKSDLSIGKYQNSDMEGCK